MTYTNNVLINTEEPFQISAQIKHPSSLHPYWSSSEPNLCADATGKPICVVGKGR